jgi:hypothetical protein
MKIDKWFTLHLCNTVKTRLQQIVVIFTADKWWQYCGLWPIIIKSVILN